MAIETGKPHTRTRGETIRTGKQDNSPPPSIVANRASRFAWTEADYIDESNLTPAPSPETTEPLDQVSSPVMGPDADAGSMGAPSQAL